MTPEIKTRIEQIRRGEVPVGYKKTKTDIVPNDWKELLLADCICEFSKKTTIPNQYPVLTSARKGLMLQKEYFTNRQVTTEDNVGYNILPYGYITFRSRSDDGKFVFNVNKIIERGIISYFYPVFSFGENVSRDFMLETLNHTIYKRMFPLVEGTAQQVLSLNKLGKLYYNVPTIAEQQKIAAILTDQDKIIELKENLLAEKQRQKKYLMQQLLTGKKRLPGFDREWKTKLLKQLSEKQKKKNIAFQYSLVLSNSAQHGIVSQDQEFDKEIANEERIDGYYIVVPGAFVYNPRISVTAPCGPINVNETGETGVMSPLYTVFTIFSSEINQDYLKYYFQSPCWYKYVKGVANYGARHDRISISDEDFFAMPIPLPPKEEQTAIAEVLSTADRELDLLRQEIEQEKQKKKALMQLLLTGMVRV